jgi:hypothetical protein
MQDRYTGDIGDFAKYGLLRQLIGIIEEHNHRFRLGIHWYLTEPEDNEDGRYLEYLENKEEFRICDRELYEFLIDIKNGFLPRSTKTIESSGLFPRDTLFFNKILSFSDMPSIGTLARKRRIDKRTDWSEKSLSTLKDADFVFLDPDNGLERVSVPRHVSKGPKYVFFDELLSFLQEGKTAIVYQHQTHDKGGFDTYLTDRMHQISSYCGDLINTPYCCLFTRRQQRAFIVLPVGDCGDEVVRRARNIMRDQHWRTHFVGISIQ